jgi:hypothetical protein
MLASLLLNRNNLPLTTPFPHDVSDGTQKDRDEARKQVLNSTGGKIGTIASTSTSTWKFRANSNAWNVGNLTRVLGSMFQDDPKKVPAYKEAFERIVDGLDEKVRTNSQMSGMIKNKLLKLGQSKEHHHIEIENYCKEIENISSELSELEARESLR